MNQNNINSLYELIKDQSAKKGRPLKIVCDWDECLQYVNPYIWYQLINENKWAENIGEFKDYCDFFWENASMDYFPTQKTTNTCNENIEKIRKDPAEFEEKIRKPFFKILRSSKLYEFLPVASFSDELLLALKDDLIEELSIISITYGVDGRKEKKFKKTFGKFPQSKLTLHTTGHFKRTGQHRWDWIKKSCPDFDIFIDDNPKIISKTREHFSKNKFYVIPDYKANRYVQGDNVFHIKNTVSDLKDSDFAKATQEYKDKKERESQQLRDKEQRERERAIYWMVGGGILLALVGVIVYFALRKKRSKKDK